MAIDCSALSVLEVSCRVVAAVYTTVEVASMVVNEVESWSEEDIELSIMVIGKMLITDED